MSWASKRRTSYALGVFIFLALVIGIPMALWIHEPPSCFDGKQNAGETAPDRGGSCVLLDARTLAPHTILWARSFEVRDGLYGAVAYIENPNRGAGVQSVRYSFGLYDENNLVVARKEGTTFIMPNGVTPVFLGAIETGTRNVVRTFFEFEEPLVWKRMSAEEDALSIRDVRTSDVATIPRVSASVLNTSVSTIKEPSFVAVVFDTAGNAIAASKTFVTNIPANESRDIVFTWPDPFRFVVGRVDVLPLLSPVVRR